MKAVAFALSMLLFATPVFAEEICQNSDCHLTFVAKSSVGTSVTIKNPRLSVPGYGDVVIYTSRVASVYFGTGLCRAFGYSSGIASETSALELTRTMAVYSDKGIFVGLFPASEGNLEILTLVCEE